MEQTKTWNQKTKTKKSKKSKDIEKKTRSSVAPSKSKDPTEWKKWYKETIQEMISQGKTISEISRELNIREDSVKSFIS
mgnify:CR=1 FL=1